jgi:hypothetical protein
MDHPTFKLGMASDQVVEIIKRTGRKRLLRPKELGQSKHGYIVRWYLQDATLTFRRDKPTKQGGRYRITEIAPPVKIIPRKKDGDNGEETS